VREQVFIRDEHRCRIPWCKCLASTGRLEWAHLKARGMGGNPDGSRDTTENTIAACSQCHRGTRSLHSGHLKWAFLTDKGANGAMSFTWCEKRPKADL
jgi:5-methylcytosine-specific restriction endonuclease McrA